MLSFTLPSRNLFNAKQMISCIEQNDAQRFLVQHPHFRRDQIVNQLG